MSAAHIKTPRPLRCKQRTKKRYPFFNNLEGLEKGGIYEKTSYLCNKTLAILFISIGKYVYCNWIRYAIPTGYKSDCK